MISRDLTVTSIHLTDFEGGEPSGPVTLALPVKSNHF